MFLMDDLEPMQHCEKCKCVAKIGLRRDIMTNGAVAIWIACLQTDQPHRPRKGGTYVTKRQAEEWGFAIEGIPIVNDYRGVGCEVEGCKTLGYENNHWAPKEIFGEHEASKWPQSNLCKPHHDEWHRRMKDYGWKATSKVPDIKQALNDLDKEEPKNET
jgi:hypothetical protein